MLNYKDWSAWISVDGQELPQFDTTVKEEISGHPNGRTTYTVSCWIASEEGKEFIVHVLTKPGVAGPQNCYRADWNIDGASAERRILTNPNVHKFDCTGKPCKVDGTESVAPFLFSRLSLTDDDSASRDASHLKDLGIICIKIDRVVITRASSYETPSQIKSVAEKGPIHEASKKAGAHCVSFGKPKASAPFPYVHAKPLDGPLIIFEFRYRSADMLRAQGIMPPVNKEPANDIAPTTHRYKRRLREPTAGPQILVKEEKSDEDVDAEIRALRARLKSLEKKRNTENISGGMTRPKKRAKIEPLNHSSFIDGEVIDLT